MCESDNEYYDCYSDNEFNLKINQKKKNLGFTINIKFSNEIKGLYLKDYALDKDGRELIKFYSFDEAEKYAFENNIIYGGIVKEKWGSRNAKFTYSLRKGINPKEPCETKKWKACSCWLKIN